ncbi:hypothetical protein TFUB20_01416 [Tannerella forsythia]|uniref:Uncharacterized protein n=1 Tax=Tannerella forsythia TaxID=28112 RepID=A0A1D3UNE3_TANFO|nr:hypothetical protein TFUB20_01416 [Tannerella forsythia]
MIPHPCGMGLKYIGLTALVPRAGKRTGSRNPNANNCICHSEHREESHGEKERDSSLRSE